MADDLPAYPPIKEMTVNQVSQRIARLKKYLERHETTADEWKEFDVIEQCDEALRELAEATEAVIEKLTERERQRI